MQVALCSETHSILSRYAHLFQRCSSTAIDSNGHNGHTPQQLLVLTCPIGHGCCRTVEEATQHVEWREKVDDRVMPTMCR